VILTADHGEELFEHGGTLHKQLYDECVHVPLLVRVPDGKVGSSDELAGLADISPTILELCGLAPPAEMQGRSLAPILRGEAPAQPARIVLDQGKDRIGVRTAGWKVAPVRADGGQVLRIFDLAADPREEHGLSWSDLAPSVADSLRAELVAELSRARALRARMGPPIPLGPAPVHEQEELQQLGYAGALDEQ